MTEAAVAAKRTRTRIQRRALHGVLLPDKPLALKVSLQAVDVARANDLLPLQQRRNIFFDYAYTGRYIPYNPVQEITFPSVWIVHNKRKTSSLCWDIIYCKRRISIFTLEGVLFWDYRLIIKNRAR